MDGFERPSRRLQQVNSARETIYAVGIDGYGLSSQEKHSSSSKSDSYLLWA
jgi:hypothetical protein